MPDMSLEAAIGGVVVGIDEAGRGPLCGPVIVAAVHIPDPLLIDGPLNGVNDSKRLSTKRRLELRDAIIANCAVSVGSASPEEIDSLNILQATFLAMLRAVEGLARVPGHVLVDGNRLPQKLPCPGTAIVKGDSKSVSIAAASIIAKTERDAIMQRLHLEYPHYGWDKNAGYPTKEHYAAIAEFGITPHHRRSFAGVLSSPVGACPVQETFPL